MKCPVCHNGTLRASLEVVDRVYEVDDFDSDGNHLGSHQEEEKRVIEPEGNVLICDGCSAAVEGDEEQVKQARKDGSVATNVAPAVKTDPKNDPHVGEGVPYKQPGADPEDKLPAK